MVGLKNVLILLFATALLGCSNGYAAELLVDLGDPSNGNASPSRVILIADTGGKTYFGFRNQLWVTDGTPNGTIFLATINNRSLYELSLNSANNGVVYFSTSNSIDGYEDIYRTDGTAAGTFLLSRDGFGGDGDFIISGPSDIYWHNNVGYFAQTTSSSGRELYKTDGTISGTELVADIYPGDYSDDDFGSFPYSSSPSDFFLHNGQVHFVATNENDGRQIWRTSGTAATTERVSNLVPSIANIFHTDGNEVFFQDNNYNVSGTDNGVFKFNRTAPTTVTQVLPVSPFRSYDLTEIAHNTFLYTSLNNDALFKMDLNAGVITELDNSFQALGIALFSGNHKVDNGESLFMIARRSEFGFEPFKINQLNEVQLIKDVNPGPQSMIHSGNSLTPILNNGNILFVAYHPSYGYELWKTDGSAAGTQIVKDIRPSTSSSGASTNSGQNISGRFYFTANDGSGKRVWSTDSTNAGTRPVVTGSPLAEETFLRSRGSGRILFTGILNGNLQLYIAEIDTDNDGATDLSDNCADTANPDQTDTDNDGDGNLCDDDDDNDGIPDIYEIANGLNPLLASDASLDSDGDGFTNLEEFIIGTNPNIVNPDCDADGQAEPFDQCMVLPPILDMLLN